MICVDLTRCFAPSGVGVGVTLLVLVNELQSAPSPTTWSYFAPVVSDVSPREGLSPLGGSELSVVGSNFGGSELVGFAGTVTVGGRVCVTVQWNDTNIVCTAPIGVARASRLVVTVAQQASLVTVVAFSSPVIVSLSERFVGTVGNTSLIVTGSNFASLSPLTVSGALVEVVSLVRLPCTATVAVNDTVVQCTVPEGGGVGWRIVISNVDLPSGEVQESAPSEAVVAYLPPTITAVSAGLGQSAAVGGFVVTISGTNLSPAPVFFIGSAICSGVVVVVPHKRVTCVAPARAYDEAAVVTVSASGQGTVGPVLAFDGPVVVSVSPVTVSALAVGDRPSVSVAGVNFGVRTRGARVIPQNHTVFVGPHECATLWLTDTQLSCTLSGDFVVGVYNVTAWVYGLETTASASTTITLECPAGYFGKLGHTCRACPEGAECFGGQSLPQAVQGYYPMSSLREEFVMCSPVEACLGGANATCARHYTGPRCAMCDFGAYRCVRARLIFVGYSAYAWSEELC